jgi:methionyl-tRNA formyltransferase
LLVAEESAGIQVLRALAASPHRVVAAMTAPPTRGGGATVGGVAETLGVPVLPSERVRDAETADWIRAEGVDLLLNVHSLYLIVGEVVAAPRIGSFNLHPGPLPEYAGLNTPSWAIYNGEPRHGVTVHWMEPEVDTGPIAYSATFDLSESDTGLSVSARCVPKACL